MNLNFGSYICLFFGLLTVAIIFIALLIFMIVCLESVFHKAGIRDILAVVPFYNLYLLFKISGMNGYLFFFLFVPVVGIVFYIMQCIYLTRKFSKSNLFALGLILFPLIFLAILGLSKAKYKKDSAEDFFE